MTVVGRSALDVVVPLLLVGCFSCGIVLDETCRQTEPKEAIVSGIWQQFVDNLVIKIGHTLLVDCWITNKRMIRLGYVRRHGGIVP